MRVSTSILASALSLGAAATVLSAPAEAAEYARENSVAIHLVRNGAEHPFCTGRAWIGQTTTNSIEAYTSVSGGTRVSFARADVHINRDSPLPEVSGTQGCDDCDGVTAAVSTPGASGGRFCVVALADTGLQFAEGGGTACITAV
jgi:hypothetical protein